MPKPVIAILFSRRVQDMVLDEAVRAELEAAFTVRWPATAGEVGVADVLPLLGDAEGCMTGWDGVALKPDILVHAPRLRIMAHSAGSVKWFVSDEVWRRGIVVTSAVAENGVDTAQFAVGLMIIACKNMMELASTGRTLAANWRARRGYRAPDDLRGSTVGIIGAGHVGRNVLRLLEAFGVEKLLYDPCVSSAQARELGAAKVELDDLFQRADLVSVHAPSLPETRHLVNAARLALMKDGAVLINTSRGSLLDEAALVAELQKRRIWAFLDVTDPEPPRADSPLLICPNLTLTPHIGGAVGRGRKRLGRLAAEELKRFFAGQPPLFPVARESLIYSA